VTSEPRALAVKRTIVGLSGVAFSLTIGSARAGALQEAVALARRTLEFVERSRPCPDLADKLAELDRRSRAVPAVATTAARATVAGSA